MSVTQDYKNVTLQLSEAARVELLVALMDREAELFKCRAGVEMMPLPPEQREAMGEVWNRAYNAVAFMLEQVRAV
ncbi:hypothetical protein [Massilia sp. DD77]|uniref:hypothetical protein n=1 Tax=Massilia sp. DD77 TaxID=3109349 RepID=UPI002FFF67F3